MPRKRTQTSSRIRPMRAKGATAPQDQPSQTPDQVSDGNGYRIGISGWRYKPWRGTFYPEDVAQKCELQYASRQLNSIEINGSFYSLQSPSSWKQWYDETPPDFRFSIKGGRYITHMRKLKDIDEPTANFFSQGLLQLEEKLGP